MLIDEEQSILGGSIDCAGELGQRGPSDSFVEAEGQLRQDARRALQEPTSEPSGGSRVGLVMTSAHDLC